MQIERLGHTGITWASTPDGVTSAIADVAALGYRGFETFGFLIDQYPGGVPALKEKLDRHGLRFPSAYCFAPLVDPATAADDVEKIVAWAQKVKDLGGSVVVVGATRRAKPVYSAEEYRGLARTLGELGRRCLDLGVVAAFHPHTGTPVETGPEIDALFGSSDPRCVFFAPDTGQIRKGGSDPIQVLRSYLPLIRHVHLKDYDGGPIDAVDADGKPVDRTGYVNYVPLGSGVVDIAGIIDTLDAAGYVGWYMVELDGTPKAPHPPREAAAMSKHHLDALQRGS
jgi:inosose dehydratase